MSEAFQKLQVKKYTKKTYKNPAEARYWKKYKDVVKQKNTHSIMDVAFCNDMPDYLCVAVSAKVDIYKITERLFESDVKAINTLFKFNDVVTTCRLRDSKDLLATGTKEGLVQIFQTKKRLNLRTFTHHKNSINSVAFNSNKVNLASCADENDVAIWELATKDPQHIIEDAHNDYVKAISYHDQNTLMTSSYDKTVKLWDVRNKLDSNSFNYYLEMSDPIENFTRIDEYNYAIANGNYISLIDIRNSDEIVRTINAHQKSIFNVRYDSAKQRLISAGADCHLKFHDLVNEKVMYTVKLPSEVLSFDISSDGQNYALGLVNGTLLIRSKKFTPDEDEEDLDIDPEAMMDKFLSKDHLVQTSKGYKHFYRGQYTKESGMDDIISKSRKKINLQKFEKYLKKFQYKNALNSALEKRSTDITVSLIEELIQRSSLEIAIANRSEEELILLLDFLIWKISDYRFSDILVEVAKIVIDMYSCVIGHSEEVFKKFKELYTKVDTEIDEQKQMLEVKSKLDTLKTCYNIFALSSQS
ncbi:unnamed protein product [Moneuplotes crassus]|uniref:U3 small nucleolar RNA-associated protein 15 C-terminal domain-containing protein n=1 Tax=Euplotes crassus TaxID=5936 RepID=A0AAD1UC60_EUPCR|nr:unnamed protein product [Moneuplotes crassus]